MKKIFMSAATLALMASNAMAEPPAMVNGKLVGDVPKIDYEQVRKMPPVDYSQPANWLCGPDSPNDACYSGLDAKVAGPKGDHAVERFTAAKSPSVDCFYLHPTASVDQGPYSDLKPDAELVLVNEQLGRLSSVCRPIAPLYRQLTAWTLVSLEDKHPGTQQLSLTDPHALDVPYQDAVAAWKYYLKHYNNGRGVVFVSQSSGSPVMARLIAEQIEGKPEQSLLVSAYIPGGIGIDSGTFKSVKACESKSQTGCVVAWATYKDSEMSSWRYLGRSAPGVKPLCVNPAELDGSEGQAISYVQRPHSELESEDAPKFIKFVNEAQTHCVTDARGGAVSVTMKPNSEIDRINTALMNAWGEFPKIYGMHELDISLFHGNITNLISSQSAAWLARQDNRSAAN
ncbi:DUF3089 domain-containing protein [Pseudomonas sp. BN414]|uniref:DUF3089 domain-containing protein n=1 Tax=Pseudomonas sp. BN414 TaxID=2567888 RepID=UPI002455074F|nr:DUF3089 domain-containing protein [Pseudomonas sp. BN414]